MTHIIGWELSAHLLWPRDRWDSSWWHEAWDADPGHPSNVLQCSCGWRSSRYAVAHVSQWLEVGQQHFRDLGSGERSSWSPGVARVIDEYRSGDQMTLEVA